MILPNPMSLRETRRLGRVALTALVIGLAAGALVTMPLDNLAFAGNGNGNGGGGGKGGGKGGGGGNGGGHGHDGGNGGGNGDGQSSAGDSGRTHGGQGSGAKAGKSGADDSVADRSSDDSATDDGSAEDGSMSPGKLGKLNGFFHASPNGLANASPNSAIGRISHTFKDALSDYAKAGAAETDPNATPPEAPSIGDLGAILAGATNKPLTGTQVREIAERLADLNPEDELLSHFAETVDDDTAQGIADAANASKSGETSDASDETDQADANDTNVTVARTAN